jgi:hypothetical protein
VVGREEVDAHAAGIHAFARGLRGVDVGAKDEAPKPNSVLFASAMPSSTPS